MPSDKLRDDLVDEVLFRHIAQASAEGDQLGRLVGAVKPLLCIGHGSNLLFGVCPI
jgi:hypothetical protein